jgi:hypothetical protein
MFPLRTKKIGGYLFGQRTFYNSFHNGTDYQAEYVNYYAPFSGYATSGEGVEGGKFWQLKTPDGHKFIARHLSKIIKTGIVKEGELVAITGNSGRYTTNPHLHQEAYKNNLLVDPEKINWGNPPTPVLQKTFMAITVIANNNTWNLTPRLDNLKKMFVEHSLGKLEPVFKFKYSNFTKIPKGSFNGIECIDVNWYRNNVTPMAEGQATLFLCNPKDYPSTNSWGYMTWGDPKRPVRIEVTALESESNVFEERAFHEICHALFFLTGQPDRVHELLYQDPPKYKALLSLIDYGKLQNALVTIN